MVRNYRMILVAAFAVALFVTLAPIATPQGAAAGQYHLLTTIKVGGEGGWDYGTVDSAGRRLYYSHGTKVVVIDIDKNEVVGEIADTPGVHGIAVVPELGLVFTSNGQENKASMVDQKTLTTKMKVETGPNPDAILYDPGQKEVYTFNGRGKNATVFEARTGRVVATIPLPGKPEFAQVDLGAGRIFCNIEDKNEVSVIDTKTHMVVAHWPIAPGEGASGMAIDRSHHRLFLGADQLMVMLDYVSGKVEATIPIGPGVDANAYDPGLKLAFASCGGDGTVTIAREDGTGKLALVQTLQTARGARTMTLDPKTHKIYLAAADYESPAEQAQPVAGQRPTRPKMVPGSFKILVYGIDAR